jgi:hypothetical protein
MEFELWVGFPQEPRGLDALLTERGFVPKTDTAMQDGRALRAYRYFVPGVCARGVWFSYHGEVCDGDLDLWASLSPSGRIVATATVSTPSERNGFDELVQYLTAKLVRDRYNAIIFDCYDGELVR